jgi:hypothetical protein
MIQKFKHMERPPAGQSWVAAFLVLVLVGAVCWLAYNTDATRIEVPGVITWNEARQRMNPKPAASLGGCQPIGRSASSAARVSGRRLSQGQ